MMKRIPRFWDPFFCVQISDEEFKDRARMIKKRPNIWHKVCSLRRHMQIFAPLHSEAIPQIQQVEVATLFQLPSFQVIGLPAPEVAEAKERIRSAIEASDLSFPRKKVILNLSPASVRKRGTGLDLAMALAVLSLQRPIPIQLVAWGELGLDGGVKPVGQLTRTLYVAWKNKIPIIMISRAEYDTAIRCLQDLRECSEFTTSPPAIIPVDTLKEAWDWLVEPTYPPPMDSIQEGSPNLLPNQKTESFLVPTPPTQLPLSFALERVIGIAAAGGHHILLLGPKGVGKSLAFEWLIGLLPKLSPEECLQQKLLAELSPRTATPNPVRRVSSQVRPNALIGSMTGHYLRPGEFSLAHGGVLIADELPEWHRDSREALREPLERGQVSLTRSQGRIELPANFLLAANGNFCPCGGWPPEWPVSRESKSVSLCRCRESVRKSYFARLSGPVLDRIDLVSFVTYCSPSVGIDAQKGESRWNTVRKQVWDVREFLKRQWGSIPGRLTGAQIEEIIEKTPTFRSLLERFDFTSYRARHKTARTALTLSAWDNTAIPQISHLTEAYYYRADRVMPH